MIKRIGASRVSVMGRRLNRGEARLGAMTLSIARRWMRFTRSVLRRRDRLVTHLGMIPWAVYTRYVINRAASWPEPTAVLLTIVVTFIGAAACYRVCVHMNVSFFVGLLPPGPRRAAEFIASCWSVRWRCSCCGTA